MTDAKAKLIESKEGEKTAGGNESAAAKPRRRRFLRYEWFKCKKLGMKWRRPVGLHSKVRHGRKGKPPKVRVGFGHARATRGLVNGHKAVIVQRASDLNRIDVKKREAAMLSSGIGMKTALVIYDEAQKRGIKILNAEKLARAQHRMRMIEKQRAERAKAAENAQKEKHEKAEAEKKAAEGAKNPEAHAKPEDEHTKKHD